MQLFYGPKKMFFVFIQAGPFLSDTTITVLIDKSAKGKDGIPIGQDFTFSFRTAALNITSTSPSNGQLFASQTDPITISFNDFVKLSSAQTSISISPAVNGSFSFGGYSPYEQLNQIKFTPSSSMQPNTKYTVTITTGLMDMYGNKMKERYTFSFVTRPN